MPDSEPVEVVDSLAPECIGREHILGAALTVPRRML
jgi:hypothetical protein